MWHENDPDRPVSRLEKEEKKAPSAAYRSDAAVEEPSYEDYDYLANSASASDMTGLIPSTILDEAQAASYEDVYDYLPPKADAEQMK
ncbi:MAG: hypothetical protein HFG80_06535 [Eubacterium sp.]|jgi:hypothetical protein|nr:hypothetical protein [Eubacterium sp.]